MKKKTVSNGLMNCISLNKNFGEDIVDKIATGEDITTRTQY